MRRRSQFFRPTPYASGLSSWRPSTATPSSRGPWAFSPNRSTTAHSTAQGWTLDRYIAAGAGWFVRSHSIEYLRPAFLGDTLTIHTWVSGFTPRSSPRRYVFVRDDDGASVASAETLWVFVDFATGRPVWIPAGVEAAFPVVADDDPELVALVGPPPRR